MIQRRHRLARFSPATSPAPWLRLAGATLLALALAVISLPAGAQIPAPPPPTEEEAAPPAPPPPVPEELASPRATMRTFLEAFDPSLREDGSVDLDAAARCMDLSSLPMGARTLEGRQRAVQLKDVLDRTRYVDFSKVPDRQDGEPYVFYASDAGSVTIAETEDGPWLFSAETVAALPDLWQEARTRPLAEGVTEAPRTLPLWIRSKIPSSWQEVTFILEQWQWIGLLLVIAFGYLVSRLVRGVFRRLLVGFFASRLAILEPRILARALLPLGMAVMALVWGLGLYPLDLPLGVLRILHHGILFLGVGSLVWFLFRLVDVVAALMTAQAEKTAGRFDDLLVPMVSKTLKAGLAIIGLIFVADNLEIEIGSLLAGLGLGGLALALAAQDTVKNIFGSLTVLTDRPFQIGDVVVVKGIEGTVEQVGFRSTRVRTFQNSLVTIPNSEFISASVDNLGARIYRRWKGTLSILYSTPPAKIDAFCEGVRELVRQHPHTREDSNYVYMNHFGASSLDILIYIFFETQEWEVELKGKHELIVDILRLAKRMGIEFAFPTQTLHIAPPEIDGDGDGPGEDDLVLQAKEIATELSGKRQLTLADAEA